MSEYQYVAFRAIDAPVSEANLAYMRKQSSRADITPWSFTNEYHFGDFRGDAVQMLQRGYDIHLHYANFGIRSLYIRLPHGLPDRKAAAPYFVDRAFRYVKDRAGDGGVLVISPFHEPGDLNDLSDLDAMIERLVPLRNEILSGDLRPLYLASLAASCDGEHYPEETIEAPPPAGLDELTAAQQALAEYYDISEALMAAAAQAGGTAPSAVDIRKQYAEWIDRQPEATRNAWLVELLNGSEPMLKGRLLAQFTKDRPKQPWPTADSRRTIAQLQSIADDLQAQADRQAADKAASMRAEILAKMAADPMPFLHETERLVAQRTLEAYGKIARLLADIREALANTSQSDLAECQARQLKQANPKLHHLAAALREEGFIPR